MFYKPFGSGSWRIVPIEQACYGAVTANISGEGVYVVARYNNVFYVSKDYAVSDPAKNQYKTLEEGLSAAGAVSSVIPSSYTTDVLATGDGVTKQFSNLSISGPILTKRYFTISAAMVNGQTVNFTYNHVKDILEADVAGCSGAIDFSVPQVSLTFSSAVNKDAPITARYPEKMENAAVVLVAAGEYTPATYYDVPPYVDLIAGFPGGETPFYVSGALMQPSDADPRHHITTLLAKNDNDYPIMLIGHNWEAGYDVVVDGFKFDGVNVSTVGWTFAGALEIRHRYNTGYEKNLIRNCVFVNNKGRFAGAVWLAEASKVFFDNCVFADNVCDAGGGGPYEAGAGAVLISQAEDGPVEAEFYSCVFSGNSVLTGEKSAAVTTTGNIISLKYPLKIVNCTFYNNSAAGAAPTNTGSICNGATYKLADPAPAIVMNSILYSNPSVKNREVYGVTNGTTPSVTYIVDNGVTSRTYSEYGISYTAIHDDVIGNLANTNNIELTVADIAQFTESNNLAGRDGTLGTGDDGLNLTMSSTLRKKAKAHGLQEYSDAALIPYFRPQFTDAGIRIRLNRNIDEVGAYEKFIRIMGVGDDNTVGWGVYSTTRDKPNNYRTPLKNLLEAANYEVEFVGSQDGGHEGVKDSTIEYFAGIVSGKIDFYKPNLILFLGGTKDIYDTTNANTVFNRLYKDSTSSFVYNLVVLTRSFVYNVKDKLNTDTRLLISTIPPVTRFQSTIDNFKVFNNSINNEDWNAVSSFINVADPTVSNQIINGDTYPNTYDKRLLFQTGYDIFAQYFFNAITGMY